MGGGLLHSSSASVRGSLHRTLTGTLVRTSCCKQRNIIVRGSFHAVGFSGPNLFHVDISSTVTKNADSTEGTEVFGVFTLMGINRHSNVNLYSVCGC